MNNITAPQPIKFGRKSPPKKPPQSMALLSYPDLAASPPPAEIHWATKVPAWTPMLNDKIGDCTIAALGHIIQVWTSNSLPYNCPPDPYILKAYEAVSGYNPAIPSSDTGCYMIDTIEYMQSTGIGVNSHKIKSASSLNPFNQNNSLVQWGIFNYGAVYYGFNCPQSAVDQFHAGQPWTVPSVSTTIAGGHAVGVFGYDANWVNFVTWGAPKKMSWQFFWTYVEEMYTLETNDWKPILG